MNSETAHSRLTKLSNMATQRGKYESKPEFPITIVMSSQLLFNMERQQQSDRSTSLAPAFFFVKALQEVNVKLKEHYPESQELFKVLLISDSPSDSDSLSKAIKIQKLEELVTPLFMKKDNLINELKTNNTHLYLAVKPGLEVQEALKEGIAAAVMHTPETAVEVSETQLRVVFDGDAVLFSDESERVYKDHGVQAFLEHEKKNVDVPMNNGPFKRFLEVLKRLQIKLRSKGLTRNCPIRTYLVTSRGAGCDGYRALNTLCSWGLEIDEAVFVGGSPKGPMLERIKPHIFFDDQCKHITNALNFGIVSCHVEYCSE